MALPSPSFATPALADSSNLAATTASVEAKLARTAASLAPLASPALTGTPTAPTVSVTDATAKLATMAAIRNVLTYVTPEMFGAVGDGSTDDSAAFTAALTYLNTAGTKLLKISHMAYALAMTTQMIVPANVTMASEQLYAGGDGLNQPQLIFSSATAGVQLGNYASIRGMHVTCNGGNPTIPCIEYVGEVGIYNVRTDGNAANGILCSRLINAASPTDLYPYSGPTSGMQNGTYTGVAFSTVNPTTSPSGFTTATNAAPAGLTLNVTVSNGTVSAVSVTGAGRTAYPSFIVSIAAGALYSGSPMISSLCFVISGQCGRSRFADIWAVNHTGIGVEIDCAYDFCNAHNLHIWNSGPQSTQALRIGKTDGLTLTGFKVFKTNIAQAWENPYPTISFATIVGTEIDLANYGICLAGPMQIDWRGGYCRAIGRCFDIESAPSIVSIAMNLLCSAADHIYASAFTSLNVVGCNFTRAPTQNSATFCVNINQAGGAGNYNVSGNTSDGFCPFIWLQGVCIGTVGPNSWPGKNYPDMAGGNPTAGYYLIGSTAISSLQNISASKGNSQAGITDANGQIAFGHGLGVLPTVPRVQIIGAAAPSYLPAIVSIDRNNITFGVVAIAGGAAAASNVNVVYTWSA